MEIGTFVLAFFYSVELIQMKLTLERFVLCLLLEIARHHSADKCVRVMYSECLSMGLPRDDAFIADHGHLFKHAMELERKREL